MTKVSVERQSLIEFTQLVLNFLTFFRTHAGAEIPMTRPVSTRVVSDEAGNMRYEMGFYIPEAFQTNTPQPTDEKVKIVERDLHVYSM